MHMSTSTLTHSLKNTHALLMWCVQCATGSRWVESQCWLSLHWAPQGVFIVAKINKAAVTKCRLDPTRTQSGTPCTPATDKQKNKKEKKNNPKHRKTKKQKTCSHARKKWHSSEIPPNILILSCEKRRAQQGSVFFKVHTLHKHLHNVTAQKRKSLKKIRNKKPTKKTPRVSPLTT